MRLVLRSLSGGGSICGTRKCDWSIQASNPTHEPYLVVAGVIINADEDWRSLERHILSLRRKYIPEDDHDGFIFHAKDIWHGYGYFNRDKWPLGVRRDILRAISEIPRRFHLPIVCYALDRALFTEFARPYLTSSSPTAVSTTGLAYLTAFVNVVRDVDGWVGANAPAEVAMLIVQDAPKIRNAIKGVHASYTDPMNDADIFTTRNIVDTAHFAAKDDSIL